MSKRRTKQRRQRFPWMLLVLGGLFVALAAFLLARPGSDDGGVPALAVDPQEIDYGVQHFGTNLTFTIKVANTGSGTLRFKEPPYIEVLEGC